MHEEAAGAANLPFGGSKLPRGGGKRAAEVVMFRPGPVAAKPRLFGSASRAQAEPTCGPEPAFGSAWHSSKPRPSRKAAAFFSAVQPTAHLKFPWWESTARNLKVVQAVDAINVNITQSSMYNQVLRCSQEFLCNPTLLLQSPMNKEHPENHCIPSLGSTTANKALKRNFTKSPGLGRSQAEAEPRLVGAAWPESFEKPKPPKPGRSRGFQAEPRPEHH
ncbi:hypothetical protein K438DRAFT_1781124 [Mycena galopus ATCC 62051]|nr:hypothetical protein K438DRAFT_1781124 [Mycena galopus ATCC 62051]